MSLRIAEQLGQVARSAALVILIGAAGWGPSEPTPPAAPPSTKDAQPPATAQDQSSPPSGPPSATPAPMGPAPNAGAPVGPAPVTFELTILDKPVKLEWEDPSDAKDLQVATIPQGAPLCLRLRLTNITDRQLTIYRPDTSRGSVGIRLIRPDGKAIGFHRPRVGTGISPLDRIFIPPHESTVLETVLYGQINDDGVPRYLFSQQGDWTIDAVFNRGISEKFEIRSNTVSVRVGPPVHNWDQIQNTGILGIIDNTEPRWAERDRVREQVRTLLGGAPNPYEIWTNPRPTPAQAIIRDAADKSPEGLARRLIADYLTIIDTGNTDNIEALVSDDLVFNGGSGAMLVENVKTQMRTIDPAKLYVEVEEARFATERPDRVIARLRVLTHDDQSGRDSRSYYFVSFEPREGAWRIVQLDIKRAAR